MYSIYAYKEYHFMAVNHKKNKRTLVSSSLERLLSPKLYGKIVKLDYALDFNPRFYMVNKDWVKITDLPILPSYLEFLEQYPELCI